jgi:hypothetical protein
MSVPRACAVPVGARQRSATGDCRSRTGVAGCGCSPDVVGLTGDRGLVVVRVRR